MFTPEEATVYRDHATGEPEWLTVMTGLFGLKETFVPLPRARAWTRSLANLAIAPVARPTEEVS